MPKYETLTSDANWCTYQLAIAIRSYFIKILQSLDAVDEQNAVQVVNFVVNHHSIKAIEDTVKGLSPLVEAGYSQVMRAYGLSIETGKAEAAIKVSLFLCSVYDLGVDQRDGRIGFHLRTISATQSNHDHPAMDADLRGGQTDPSRAVFQCVI
jgi:hypothetical protein